MEDIQDRIRKAEDRNDKNLRTLKSVIGYPVVGDRPIRGCDEEEAKEIGERYINFLDMINLQLEIAVKTATEKYGKYKGEKKVGIKKIVIGKGNKEGRILEI